ncbi:MAG: flagellar biosynthesis anti-sigma factor FlgM [Catonella sp.]|uniref:flagellar biosynthesis anti-sigma factor FlgM n=1 Tax=Catonella sp. TaxID=2382125 RepID=UPI003FA17E63
MRVDNYGQVANAYKVSKARKAEAVFKANKVNDTVEISNAAKTFQVTRTAVAAAPDIREEKVAKLKAAIEEGTYTVSGREIADKLVEGYFAV